MNLKSNSIAKLKEYCDRGDYLALYFREIMSGRSNITILARIHNKKITIIDSGSRNYIKSTYTVYKISNEYSEDELFVMITLSLDEFIKHYHMFDYDPKYNKLFLRRHEGE